MVRISIANTLYCEHFVLRILSSRTLCIAKPLFAKKIQRRLYSRRECREYITWYHPKQLLCLWSVRDWFIALVDVWFDCKVIWLTFSKQQLITFELTVSMHSHWTQVHYITLKNWWHCSMRMHHIIFISNILLLLTFLLFWPSTSCH